MRSIVIALTAFAFATHAVSEQNQPALTLHPASSMVRLTGPTAVPMPPAAGSYSIDIANRDWGEWEAFQMLVSRPAQDILEARPPLEVSVKIVVQGQFPEMPPRIDSYQILDVHYTGPAGNPVFNIPVRNTGWIPDVCYPTVKAVASDRDPDKVTFLFDIIVHEVSPRSFNCLLTFSSPPLPDATLNLTVLVHPVIIPRPLPFKTAVTWNWGIEKYMGRELTAKERMSCLDFFLNYRFTPASFFTKGLAFSPEEIAHIVKHGGNVFQVFHIGGNGKRLLSDKNKEAAKPQLEECRKVLKDAGALQYACALIADEPADDTSDTIRANATWLKSVFPELKIWVASRPRKELLDVVDIWDPITAHSTDIYAKHSFTQESYELARSIPNKPEMWWFYSVEPYAPRPNCRIDDNLVDSRYIGWLSYLQGMDGFEYFWATDWGANASLRDVPYPEKAAKWNLGLAGAGQLCYPGNDGHPIPSLRLINLRDAMEDWALFLAAGLALKEQAPKDARSPEELTKLRQAAFSLIERK